MLKWSVLCSNPACLSTTKTIVWVQIFWLSFAVKHIPPIPDEWAMDDVKVDRPKSVAEKSIFHFLNFTGRSFINTFSQISHQSGIKPPRGSFFHFHSISLWWLTFVMISLPRWPIAVTPGCEWSKNCSVLHQIFPHKATRLRILWEYRQGPYFLQLLSFKQTLSHLLMKSTSHFSLNSKKLMKSK